MPDAHVIHTIEDIPEQAVVVGNDGSAHSGEAFREALEAASAFGRPLVVLRTFSIATAPRTKDWTFGYVPSVDEFAEAVAEELIDDTAKVRDEHPDVDVTYCVLHGPAAKNLVAASRRASLMVVGSRGLGGFAEMVLGSVSDQVVRYSVCPVLVTRSA